MEEVSLDVVEVGAEIVGIFGCLLAMQPVHHLRADEPLVRLEVTLDIRRYRSGPIRTADIHPVEHVLPQTIAVGSVQLEESSPVWHLEIVAIDRVVDTALQLPVAEVQGAITRIRDATERCWVEKLVVFRRLQQ